MGRKLVSTFLAGFLLWGQAPAPIHAGTFYIAPTGNDTTGAGTSGNPWQTLTKLKAATTGCGDTWVLMNGTYTLSGQAFTPTTLPSCSSWSSSTTVTAETPFGAIVTVSGGLDLKGGTPTETTYYMKVDGIVWDSTASSKNISGHYIYMKNVGFVGGPKGNGTSGSGSNVVNLDIGNNDFGASKYGAMNILIEDFFVLGRSAGSGRYGIDVFNGYGVLLRRGVFHMEDGWLCNSCGNPSASINFYNSVNSFGLNLIDLDSGIDGIPAYETAFYGTSNSGTGAVSDLNNCGYYGSVVMNNSAYAGITDGSAAISSFTYRNVAGIDLGSGGMSLGSHAVNNNVTVENVTLIIASATPAGDGIAKYAGGGTTNVKNSIVRGFSSNNDFRGLSSVTYSDTFGNGSSTAGTGMVTYDPLLNGASTWLRIETGSALKSAGSGGQMGAQIVYRLGPDGAFYGDANWDQPTATLLWPYPNQATIKSYFCAEYSTYGWCSSAYNGLDLTQYVHARGNAPSEYYSADVTSPTAPGTPTVTSTGTTTLDLSWSASSDAVGVTSYEIDVSTDNFSTFSAGYNDFDMGSGTTEQLTGLTASTAYVFRVRAKDAAGNTSSASGTGGGTTNSAAAPSSGRVSIGGGTVNFGGGRVQLP